MIEVRRLIDTTVKVAALVGLFLGLSGVARAEASVTNTSTASVNVSQDSVVNVVTESQAVSVVDQAIAGNQEASGTVISESVSHNLLENNQFGTDSEAGPAQRAQTEPKEEAGLLNSSENADGSPVGSEPKSRMELKLPDKAQHGVSVTVTVSELLSQPSTTTVRPASRTSPIVRLFTGQAAVGPQNDPSNPGPPTPPQDNRDLWVSTLFGLNEALSSLIVPSILSLFQLTFVASPQLPTVPMQVPFNWIVVGAWLLGPVNFFVRWLRASGYIGAARSDVPAPRLQPYYSMRGELCHEPSVHQTKPTSFNINKLGASSPSALLKAFTGCATYMESKTKTKTLAAAVGCNPYRKEVM